MQGGRRDDRKWKIRRVNDGAGIVTAMPNPQRDSEADQSGATPTRADSRPALSFDTNVQAIAVSAEFVARAEEYGLTFDEGDIERLGRYLAMVLSANELLNLTAITEPSEMWVKHIFDSLTLIPMLAELPDGARVVDVGSGAGMPCIPLAITMPTLRFTAIESTAKKSAFIASAAEALGLRNVQVIAKRAEDVAGTWVERSASGREKFDAVVARAVGRLAVLLEWCVPLMKVGGLALLIKGQKADEELEEAGEAMRQLGCQHAGTVDSPTGRIVAIEKTKPTARTYPRRPGEATKNPL